MFWDTVSLFYDLFEKVYNGEVNKRLVLSVSKIVKQGDSVLECACGTGMITSALVPKCSRLIATDYSMGMLRRVKRKFKDHPEVIFKWQDITDLEFLDNSFDKVVAGNVIHLLDHPDRALREMYRVARPGGSIIVPTYINNENSGKPSLFVRILEKSGAGFKAQYDFNSYRQLFVDLGYLDTSFEVIQGKMPCAIAVIRKK